ncbi:MAG: hydroxypyruvate isomerase, partial [Planctomycetes bacterium]|nr:hydroxypyruvate isomerase [Planctomycetota bacterium]
MNHRTKQKATIDRRHWISGVAAAAGALALNSAAGGQESAVKKGRIKQSLVQWCYQPYRNVDEMCKVARQLGCVSIELAPPEDWPTIKRHGLTCAISPSHLFVQGMNNPRYQSG